MIAIGDKPDMGTAYRAGAGLFCCGVEHRFTCTVEACTGTHELVCTAPDGHLVGDVPHVATAVGLGVVGIWDGTAELLGIIDADDRYLTNIGAVL